MNCYYGDILNKMPDAPQWWDEHAVPRFCEFTPEAVTNIYANEAALVLIACQNCGRRFRVAFSWHPWAKMTRGVPSIADCIKGHTLHYGDPPNAACCLSGPTMNSEPLQVLEYWSRYKDTNYEWKRDKTLEVELGGIGGLRI